MPQHRRTLTVYHIRSYIDGQRVISFDQILRNPEEVQAIDLTRAMTFEARLFISTSEPRLPSWVDFLTEGFSNLQIPSLQSINAVLTLKIRYEDDEIFAFTFGYGRYLLRSDSYDRNYGLRVALNVIYDRTIGDIDPNRLRSVDAKTVAENIIRTRRQTDRKAPFETFGIDIQRDLLRAVTGTPIASEIWGTRISGSDSLTTNPAITFVDLGDYCRSVAETYRKDTYLEHFDWIDNIKMITDPDQIERLQETLEATLLENSGKIGLTIPGMIEWGEIANFQFSFDPGNTFTDPDDADLIGSLTRTGHLDELTTERLKSWHLEALSDDGDIIQTWPLLRCLSGEITVDEEIFILSEGDFFEVRNDFLQELDQFIQSLQETTHHLPDSPGDIPEGDYNVIAAQSSDSFLLLDKKTVRVSGQTSPVEICDVLTEDGCFIHVKRKLSSSSLSHLFAQGANSADLFLMSHEYRVAVSEMIREQEETEAVESGNTAIVGRFSNFDTDGISPRQYEVSYAIVAKWRNRSFSEALPFFSKITLRRHVEDIHRMGYKVSVARVNIV